MKTVPDSEDDSSDRLNWSVWVLELPLSSFQSYLNIDDNHIFLIIFSIIIVTKLQFVSLEQTANHKTLNISNSLDKDKIV